MDRVSIGNARLYDMEEDLGMAANDYLLAVSVLFITYCVSVFFVWHRLEADIYSFLKHPRTQC